MTLFQRVRQLHRFFASPQQCLIPRETLVAFVVTSPLFTILLSKQLVYGDWSRRLNLFAGTIIYSLVTAMCLHGVFNGVLARAKTLANKGPANFLLYWIAAIAVVVATTLSFSPIFDWMAIPPDPARRIVQGCVIVTFYLAAAFLFKHATERIANEQSSALKARAAALDARCQALQARTNPHFLFNTLNSILSLIARNPEKAEQLVGRLSTLMRYSIEGADRSHVSLREELNAVRDYVEIERVRFEDRLQIKIEIKESVNLAMRVPPMVLQPLVENAILHGVARSIHGGRVFVTVCATPEHHVEMSVENDAAPDDAAPHTGTRTGLANLRERLRILYGADASLVTERLASGNYMARLIIPEQRLS